MTDKEAMNGCDSKCEDCPDKPNNEFNPDWDAIAVMVEEQQRMAKRIEELTQLVTSQGIRLMDLKTQPDVPETAFGETEPVAWMYDWTTSDGEFIQDWTTSEAETLRDTKPNIISNLRPLYTAPPKREWVGLTDEDVAEAGKLNIEGERMLPYSFARAIEAKLKEKNDSTTSNN